MFELSSLLIKYNEIIFNPSSFLPSPKCTAVMPPTAQNFPPYIHEKSILAQVFVETLWWRTIEPYNAVPSYKYGSVLFLHSNVQKLDS